MEKYIFIFGNWPKISQQELKKALEKNAGSVELWGSNFALIQSKKLPTDFINQLGGTVKLGRFLEQIQQIDQLKAKKWLAYLLPILENDQGKKINFSFSLYQGNNKEYQILDALAQKVKKELKKTGHKARYVSSKKAVLSSVIVKKNNLLNKELLIIKEKNSYFLGLTQSVQDFASYSFRDFQRPNRDDLSGMLPPKLAQMIINLASFDRDKNILDPFCGSGTILQEALLLGFRKISGSDNSDQAIADSQKNLAWLKKEKNISAQINLQKTDVRQLAKIFPADSIDLIVTEPFMGDSRFIQKQKNISGLEKTKTQLQELYLTAFSQFKKILRPEGRIVFIFPLFNIDQKKLNTLEIKAISRLGFDCQSANLIYNREKQKVERQITIWQRSS